MKQCKALLTKEFRTHWTTLFMPLWFSGGVYVIAILGFLIALLKGEDINFIISVKNVPSTMANLFLYSGVYAMNLMLGTVAIISSITLADNLINGGYKRKCEILHLSQPVSLIKILGIKYLLMVVGTLGVFAVTALFNSLVVSQVQAIWGRGSTYFGVVAWLQSTLEISLSLIFLSSLFWMFAGIYKRKSFFMGVLTLFAIQAAISILNWTAGLAIPSLLGYIANLASVRFELNGNMASQTVDSVFNLINHKWALLFSWDSLLKLIYGAVFFVAGGYLYNKRDLS